MSNTHDPRAKLPDAPYSDNERLKNQSDYLHGTISRDLTDGITGSFKGDNFQLIRFHGMYEQDDRDIRAERVEQKLEPLKSMMLRCRLPGGIINPKQWLGIDQFASEHTLYGSIRLTNRQTFQYHGVLKPDIKPMHQWLHKLGLDSIATASDVNRNVLCTTNPVESSLHKEAYEWAKKISMQLLPRTSAYADIWLDGEKVFSSEPPKPLIKEVADDVEPILGKTYLPRKFKTAVVIPPDNEVDIHSNDLGFVAIEEDGHLVGFNVLVGGGLSSEHGNTTTFPNKSYEFGFVPLSHTLHCAEAVVTTQRDWGDRGDRIGWVKGEEGNWHLTLFIENGRITDQPGGKQLKTGLRKIAEIHKGDFRLTANQNLIVAGVPPRDKKRIETIAREHGLIDPKTSKQRENSMACVALPTCPLAMAEAERFLPGLIDRVDEILEKHGIPDEHIILRVTGCPNGCGRAMLAEIGLVGKAVGRYNLFAGGNREGTRIPRLYKENITEAEILAILDEWIGAWAREREANEGFGDYAIRRGIVLPVLDAPRDFWAA